MVERSSLVTLKLPKAETITQGLILADNPRFQHIEMPRLHIPAEEIRSRRNPALTQVTTASVAGVWLADVIYR